MLDCGRSHAELAEVATVLQCKLEWCMPSGIIATGSRWPLKAGGRSPRGNIQIVPHGWRSCSTSAEISVRLAQGKVETCLFAAGSHQELKVSIVNELVQGGWSFRCGGPLSGRRVGSGARMRRPPALYRPKKWRLAAQAHPVNYFEEHPETGFAWRQNYASIDKFTEKVHKVLHDQTQRRQVIWMSEQESQSGPSARMSPAMSRLKEQAG